MAALPLQLGTQFIAPVVIREVTFLTMQEFIWSEIKRRAILEIEKQLVILLGKQAAQKTLAAATSFIPYINVIGWTLTAYSGIVLLRKIAELIEMKKAVEKGDFSLVPKTIVDTVTAEAQKKYKNVEEEDLHRPWCDLDRYRDKTRTGLTTVKKNRYYYEKDYTHIDVEVYKKMGSKGVHCGSVPIIGGKIYKPPVPGRTINL